MPSMFSGRVSQSRIRKSTGYDLTNICLKVLAYTEASKDKAVSILMNSPMDVAQRIVQGRVDHYILDEQIVVCYDVGSPWYTDKIAVQELAVLRIAPGASSLKDVVDLLDDIADKHAAHCVIVGGALSDRPDVLARAYSRYGFRKENNPELVKWRK